ncbi:MAG: glucose-1-phosphate adenylyltransferase [Verrucomicrobiae bacterium]|nr:glucose-1-phosphate adenylyltransferase [Verrucomicrobiae bacterium]
MVNWNRKRTASNNVVAIIMGGGQGQRLFPLTKERAKPAVPLGGKYRLVDIPISNCINSGLKRIYILTQFNSTSLHRHVYQSYKFDHFEDGFVEILAAQQTYEQAGWYQGTADAVRQNLRHFVQDHYDYALILSGDQLYRMDFQRLIAQHIESYADITVAALPIPREKAKSLGILQINEERRITRFVEKPKEDALLDELKVADPILSYLRITSSEDHYLASMGIYLFNRSVLKDMLDNQHADFGKHIIPEAIHKYRVFSYIFQGYWEDIGTIGSFFEANLDLTNIVPQFNFFDMMAPVYTHPRYLPGSKVNASLVTRAILSDGCILNDARIDHSIIGIRSIIDGGCEIRDSIIMGADFYETEQSRLEKEQKGLPMIGIGKNCKIIRTIVDKNAEIGDNVISNPEGKPANADYQYGCIRDGIVVIPRGMSVPSGTVICG